MTRATVALLFLCVVAASAALISAGGVDSPKHPGDANFAATSSAPSSKLEEVLGNQKKLMKDLKAFLMESDYPTTRTLAQSVYTQADTTSKTTLIQEAITKILKEHWYAERQAVFNLLSFPGLIPHDVVLKYLLKGMTETKEKSYLMATVGTISEIKFKDNLNEHVKSLLIKAIEENNDPISTRALASLDKFIKFPDDAAELIPLLSHRDKHTREKLQKYFVTKLRETQAQEDFIKLLVDNGVDEQKRVMPLLLLEWVEQQRNEEKRIISPTAEAPPIGLNDYYRIVKYRNCLGQFYKKYDADQDGMISRGEATNLLMAMKKQPHEIEKLYEKADESRDGELDVDEWFYMLKEFVKIDPSDLDIMNEDGTTSPEAKQRQLAQRQAAKAKKEL